MLAVCRAGGGAGAARRRYGRHCARRPRRSSSAARDGCCVRPSPCSSTCGRASSCARRSCRRSSRSSPGSPRRPSGWPTAGSRCSSVPRCPGRSTCSTPTSSAVVTRARAAAQGRRGEVRRPSVRLRRPALPDPRRGSRAASRRPRRPSPRPWPRSTRSPTAPGRVSPTSASGRSTACSTPGRRPRSAAATATGDLASWLDVRRRLVPVHAARTGCGVGTAAPRGAGRGCRRSPGAWRRAGQRGRTAGRGRLRPLRRRAPGPYRRPLRRRRHGSCASRCGRPSPPPWSSGARSARAGCSAPSRPSSAPSDVPRAGSASAS